MKSVLFKRKSKCLQITLNYQVVNLDLWFCNLQFQFLVTEFQFLSLKNSENLVPICGGLKRFLRFE